MRLRFSDAVETIYNREMISVIHRSTSIQLLVGVFLYDTFLFSDYYLDYKSFDKYLIGRVLICTPICLFISFWIAQGSRYYQWLTCIYPLALTATLSGLIIATEGTYRTNYLFGNILIMICSAVITRAHVPFVTLTVVLQSVCYILVLALSDVVAPGSEPVSILFCLSGAVVAVMASYAIERTNRRAFLLNQSIQSLNRELEAAARTDPLTGLGNRRSFEEDVHRYWLTADPNAQVSLILLDVDRFKAFNDNYGHPAGDACLKILADCLAENVRRGRDLAVRFGGEEMVVFLPDTDFTEARYIADGIRTIICDAAVPHPVLGPGAVVTASLGVATGLVSECSAVELVRQADQALYAAKRNGRNQVWPPLVNLASRVEEVGSYVSLVREG